MAEWSPHQDDHRRLARLTLRYLLRRPRAMDTAEGIAAWWIRQQRIDEAVQDVHRALRLLVDHGLILEHRGPGRRSYYRLNRGRIADVTRFLEQPEGS